MLISEFLSHIPKNIIVEGQMKYGKDNDWFKDYYWKPFADGLEENNVYSFNIDDRNIDGIIQDGANVKQQFINAIAERNESMLKAIRISVQELDDDGNPIQGAIHKNVRLNQIFKDEKIKGELKPNLGNIAELILGCAVTTKFEKQGQPITKDELISLAERLAEGKGTVQTNSGKDAITFTASVPFIDKKAFFAYVGKDSRQKTVKDYKIPQDTLDGIAQHINSAIQYVNTSKRVQTAISKTSDDAEQNSVEVVSDGGNAEQQKITKVDLKIKVDGTSYNLLSIKAGRVGQFGQVSGYTFDVLNNFFQQSTGLGLSSAVQKKFLATSTEKLSKDERDADIQQVRDLNYHNAFTTAYDEIERSLKRMAKADQAGFVKQIYDGILQHATRKQENVEMVILTPSAKKAFSELTFGSEFAEALNDYQLVVERGSSEKMHIIEIYGFPITTKVKKAMGIKKELLVKYRSYLQKNAVRNIIEMGDLLKELADWEKIEQRKTAKAAKEPSPDHPAHDIQQPDELTTIKKNAGITQVGQVRSRATQPTPALKTSQQTIGQDQQV